MVEFSDRDSIKRWLDAIKPAKRRREVAVALAARAALRAMPLLGRELTHGKRSTPTVLSDFVLPSLRATALPWVVGKYPAHSTRLHVFAESAASAALSAAVDAASAVPAADPAGFAASAAVSGSNATAAAASACANYAAAAYAFANYASPEPAHPATRATAAYADAATDANFIDAGHAGPELMALALWQDTGAADWATKAWRNLKSALLATDQGWEVWTEWYEARLDGDKRQLPNEALEVARATIPDEIWKQGPAAVNADIKQLIAKHSGGTSDAGPNDGSTQYQSSFQTILATRAALRVVPLLLVDNERIGQSDSRLALSVFRALAAAWARTEYSALVDAGRCVAAARDVSAYAKRSALLPRLVGNAAAEAAFSAGSKNGSVVGRRALVALARAKGAVAAVGRDTAALSVIIEQANDNDKSDIVSGVRPDQLGQIELWPSRNPPDFVGQQWGTLKDRLQLAYEGWDVWIDWYEARLDGRLRSRDIELAYVNYVRNVSSSAPASVANSEIRRLIEAASGGSSQITPLATSFALTETPDIVRADITVSAPPVNVQSLRFHIPAPRPAAIEPIFKSGRLTLPKEPAEATLSGQTIPVALKALAQTLAELAKAAVDESNIDRRIIQRLNTISESIPKKRPNQAALFRLGHEYDELKGYSKIVAESWPGPVAARYTVMTLAFERTLRRFPKWVDFTQEPPIGKVSAAEAQDISRVADALSDVLRSPENQIVVDPVLPDAIDNLASGLAHAAERVEARPDPIEVGSELLAQDVLESLNNTLKRIAEGALTGVKDAGKVVSLAAKKSQSYLKEFGEGADASLRKSSRNAGESVGPTITKLFKLLLYTTIGKAGAALTAPTLLAWLTGHYPQMYAWLEPVVALLK